MIAITLHTPWMDRAICSSVVVIPATLDGFAIVLPCVGLSEIIA